jgi:hypothetical protein
MTHTKIMVILLSVSALNATEVQLSGNNVLKQTNVSYFVANPGYLRTSSSDIVTIEYPIDFSPQNGK